MAACLPRVSVTSAEGILAVTDWVPGASKRAVARRGPNQEGTKHPTVTAASALLSPEYQIDNGWQSNHPVIHLRQRGVIDVTIDYAHSILVFDFCAS